jgi:acyl carrier protein
MPEVTDGGEVAGRIRGYLLSEVLLDDSAELTDETPLLSGLLDSIALMDVVAFLEDEFGVALEYGDVDATNFRTVGAIADLVSRRTAEP